MGRDWDAHPLDRVADLEFGELPFKLVRRPVLQHGEDDQASPASSARGDRDDGRLAAPGFAIRPYWLLCPPCAERDRADAARSRAPQLCPCGSKLSDQLRSGSTRVSVDPAACGCACQLAGSAVTARDQSWLLSACPRTAMRSTYRASKVLRVPGSSAPVRHCCSNSATPSISILTAPSPEQRKWRYLGVPSVRNDAEGAIKYTHVPTTLQTGVTRSSPLVGSL